MKLTEITKLEEFTSIDKVNKHLEIGWKVVQLYTTAYDTEPPRCAHQTAHYVLAWFGENPQYPPSENLLGTYL